MKLHRRRLRAQHLFSLFVALLMIGTLTNVGINPTRAAGLSPQLDTSQIHNLSSIQVGKSGTARVIVTLNLTFRPEASLSTSDQQSQRNAIEQARNRVLSSLTGAKYTILGAYQSLPLVVLRVDQAGLQKLSTSPDVRSVREDHLNRPSDLSSNPVIGQPVALAAGLDGTGYAVAILDSGVQGTHPFFGGRVIKEACFSTTDPEFKVSDNFDLQSLCPNGQSTHYDPLSSPSVLPGQTGTGSGTNCPIAIDGCEHGTHVAGIAAGKDYTGGPGYNGVAPGAKIIAIQVFTKFVDLGSSGICGANPSPCISAFDSDIVAALQYVHDLQTSIAPTKLASINMSLGDGINNMTPCADSPYTAIVNALIFDSVATVIASGNESFTNGVSGPACTPNTISVGATTDLDLVASFSNRANYMSLYAPGVSVDSSVPTNTFANLQGTSMAAPHVAGAWAVMRQKYPTASVTEILTTLQTTGKPITDSGITKSRIQLNTALGLPAAPPLPPGVDQVVTNLNDSGTGSLRAAVTASGFGSRITFQAGLTGTITLTTGEIVVSSVVTIVGPGARVITVSGGGTQRIFHVTSGAAGTTTISGLTLINGNPSDNFGGGGLLIDSSPVNVNDVTFSGHTAPFATSGGTGGALDNEGGVVTLTRTTFTNNSTDYRGGAIFNGASGSMRIVNSTITGNTAGATGKAGGIRSAAAQTTIVNSTIFGNTANKGANLAVNSGNITLQNSIVAGGIVAGTSPVNPDVHIDAGTFTSADYNLIQTLGSTVFDGTTTHDVTGVSPALGALANNGGQTDTMLPGAGSPVIDKIPGTGACNNAYISTDQRSYARPFNVLCDIGAVEVGASPHFDTAGVFQNGTFYLRNNNTAGPADITVAFGAVGDLPATGDWNGDGVDTIGVFKAAYGVYLLRDSNTAGAPDYSFVMGNPGDTPVVGRWDATMTHDGVGVFRPSNGLLYLKRSLTTGFADYTMVLGNPGDKGIAGDWDGNGFDSIGVFRPSNGVFFLSNSVAGTTGVPAVVFGDFTLVFGAPTGLPFTGDWTGNGTSRIGMAINGIIYQRNTLDSGAADNAFAYGPPDALPIAGRWTVGSLPPMPDVLVIQPVVVKPPLAATPKPITEPGEDGSFD